MVPDLVEALIRGPHPKGIEENRTRDQKQLATISKNFIYGFSPLEVTLVTYLILTLIYNKMIIFLFLLFSFI